MLTTQQQNALTNAVAAARAAGHVYPEMAAVEAMVESAWMTSELAQQAHNIFGCKQYHGSMFGSVALPTREFLNHAWTQVEAAFVDYPDDASAFRDRQNTLERLQAFYPHYAAALKAGTPEDYVTEVSKSWSTDPNRAATCIAIFRAHADLLR